MYNEKMLESMKKVAANRVANAEMEPRRMTAEEKEALLAEFHPDYKQNEFAVLSIGENKGEKVPTELCELLQAHSRISASDVDLTKVDYETDVLIIGGGGAGASAAIEANEAGVSAMIVTKLRIGDANTMMAEGGIQAADKPNDSPAIHYLDAFGGGHFAAKPELLYKLVNEAPEAIQWLNDLGVEFDKTEDGTMVTTHGGGTSRKRMHAAKDYSGAEIMRTLRDEVINRGIPVVDFTAAVELILDENGNCAGAVLMNMETKELLVAKAKTVILATGGAGRLHYQGFPTSNHYGATADGLVLGYRVGAKLLYADTLQYHPTGAAYPEQIFGALVTEKVRSIGAKLINARNDLIRRIHGNVFFDYAILVFIDGAVKKVGLCPERTNRHDGNAIFFEFTVQRTAEAQNEGFRRAVYVDIGDRLERRHRCDIDDLRTLFHIGDRKPAHGKHRSAVEVHHIEIILHRGIHCRAEFAISAAIDKQSNVGIFHSEQCFIGLEACLIGKVKRDGFYGKGNDAFQGFQTLFAACNDPNLVKVTLIF